MAGRIPSKSEIKTALGIYLANAPGVESAYDEPTDTYHLKDANGKEATIGPGWQCSDKGLMMTLGEILMDSAEAPKAAQKSEGRVNVPVPKRSDQNQPVGQTVRDVQVADLTMQDIKDFICPDATEQEAYMFLQLCKARNLNPFTREAYLVKYGGKANMIVGKEAFTRKAEMHPQFDGFKAGVLVKKGDAWEEREGSFLMQGEELLGGFAEVYRKDRKQPFKAMVSLREYSKNQATWKDMPGVMIRKVALVSALREAFACDLGGMYDAAEVGGSA